ncbi:hypothetical protein [Dactylosporangium sp. CS-033363]|uniref:hypothetical protein n=1 Tax=Dactylosporangium sp. CS-033363 TaxID=3239935 RepID=UPI003D8A417D
MDVPSAVINVAALALSLAAFAISTLSQRYQATLMKASNQLPVILEHFLQLRSNGFINREINLRNEIGTYPSDLGFSRLPEPLRTEAYEICLYYHDLTYMIRHGGVDQGLLENFRFRMIATWLAVRDHVRGERELRGGDAFLSGLEELFERLTRHEPELVESVSRYNRLIDPGTLPDPVRPGAEAGVRQVEGL